MTLEIIENKKKQGMKQEKTFPSEIKAIRDDYAKINDKVLGLMKKHNFKV